jgi:hypothetical protein
MKAPWQSSMQMSQFVVLTLAFRAHYEKAA